MTIVFTSVTPQMICMTADRAVTRIVNQQFREYDTGPKLFPFPGIGCVTTWGARDHNRIREHLEEQRLAAGEHNVNDLAAIVDGFLRKTYRPHTYPLDDVGYHVAGFDNEQQPRLYHIFWGFNRPKNPRQKHRHYQKQPHSYEGWPLPLFLYNGRNDIADRVVRSLLYEMREVDVANQNFSYSATIVRFGDLVARFAAELTQEVGPPFETAIISPNNQIEVMTNNSYGPLDDERIALTLRLLGIPQRIAQEPQANRQVEIIDPVFRNPVDPPTAPSGIRYAPYTGGTVTPGTALDDSIPPLRGGTISPSDLRG